MTNEKLTRRMVEASEALDALEALGMLVARLRELDFQKAKNLEARLADDGLDRAWADVMQRLTETGDLLVLRGLGLSIDRILRLLWDATACRQRQAATTAEGHEKI